MENKSIRSELDIIISDTTTFNAEKLPTSLQVNIGKWKWGSYGWISPASLIFTAAWRKYFFPSEDCCKIWARDEQGSAIPGGYSIRSYDEGVSIPLLSKHDLCRGFCSDNSGMQGSRAIEKMRALKRLDTDFDTSQRTVFNLKLFANILNEIDDLNKEQALELAKFLIVIAKRIKNGRKHIEDRLRSLDATFDVLEFIEEVQDPELIKCVVAACLDIIFGPHNLILEGVADYKTAADARAKKPGDLNLTRDEVPIIAAEVKGPSISLDWQNVERAIKILESHPSISNFIFIMGKRESVADEIVKDMLSSAALSTYNGAKISFISVHDFYVLANSLTDETTITLKTSEYLSLAPAVKPETKKLWLARASESMRPQ